ncbi:MAG: glycosyltransferase [Gammaproteobacteria bacterium]|nr:MAG: glycosyltransferase [Gammaproteobacteria bacterium]
MDASIIIRTYNEARWLPAVLEAIANQTLARERFEVLVVDSGSTDGTREIAKAHGCRLVSISKEEFTFGRSLNLGCAVAEGRALVFLSGHCIPATHDWLERLIAPLGERGIAYVYGRQLPHERSKYSEGQLFRKYFPERSALPQEGFFCNNGNAALLREVWQDNLFNEALTGLEDMDLAKRLLAQGWKVGYIAEAPVYHIHEESWLRVRQRYEREAIALQAIMPEIHVDFIDFLRYFVSGVLFDWASALRDRCFLRFAGEIVMFRLMQYWGTWRGNNDHRKLSRRRKEAYFYPR